MPLQKDSVISDSLTIVPMTTEEQARHQTINFYSWNPCFDPPSPPEYLRRHPYSRDNACL